MTAQPLLAPSLPPTPKNNNGIQKPKPLVFAYGTVLSTVYEKPDTRWGIARVRIRTKIQWVKGEILPIEKGLLYQFGGWWEDDEKWGPGFRVRFRREVIPSDTHELFNYLAALQIPHLGNILCRRIVDMWGLRSLQVLEESTHQLIQLGLTSDQCDEIQQHWQHRLPSRSLLAAPEAWGLDPEQAHSLFERYGGQTLSLLRQDPYAVLQDAGVGFSAADHIAERVGIDRLDPRRSRAALRSILSQAAHQEGHTALPRQELLARTRTRRLQLNGESSEVAIQQLLENGSLCTVPGCDLIGLRSTVSAEEALMQKLRSFSDFPVEREPLPPPSSLLDEQAAAVQAAQKHRFMVLTGSPGTGKTFTLRAILHSGWETPILAAPTGKAANRLSELTGLPAFTLHRLLEYKPGQEANRTSERPLDADLVIVDEAAMIDVPLAAALLKAIDPSRTTLILCGDADQLPPVGPGNVLRDIINSEEFPVVRLQQIVRQDASSQIIPNARRVLEGVPIHVDNQSYTDFKYFSVDASTQVKEQEELKNSITDVFDHLMYLGYSPRDVQVLTPMKKGPLPGAHALNKVLQHKLNPSTPKNASYTQGSDTSFRVGDRVIQLRNDYERSIFNGDTGVVTQVNGPQVQVAFEDKTVVYDDNNLLQLELAYAISIHKSQGSEWPVVILPLSLHHKQMLTRRLLYTAITRAKKLFVLVGCSKAVAYALAQNDDNDRITTLPYWIAST